MHKGLVSSISFLVLINLIIKPIYILGIDRQVQNILGPDEYGVYFALFNFTFLFHIVNDFGIQSYNARYIAQNKETVRTTLQQFLTVKLILGLVYGGIVLVAASLLGYGLQLFPIIGLLAFNHVCIGYVYYLRTNFTGLGMYRQDAWLSVMDRGLLIILVGSLLFIPALSSYLNIYTFILAQTAAFIIAIISGLLMLRKHWPPKLSISLKSIIPLLRKTWPYALTVFLMTLYTRLDGVMIERLHIDGSTEAGIYASGYRLLDAANMVIFLFASLLLPQLASAWNDLPKLKSLFSTGFRMLFILCSTVVMISYFYADEMISLLYVHASDYWGMIFKILMLTYLSIGVIYLFSTYITASGQLRRMNTWFIVGIGANLVLNFIYIPQYGAQGAAYATLITQSIVAIGLIIEGKNCLSYLSEISWTKLLLYLVSLALLCFLAQDISISIWIKILALGVLALFIAFLLNILPKDTLKDWLSSKSIS